MTEQHAYSTDDPAVVAAFTAAIQARCDFSQRVVDDAETLGKNKGVLRMGGVFGRCETVGLAPDDPNDPPEGWTYIRSRDRLEPRRGKAGDAARRWLADHQPPDDADGRTAMEAHGLPRHTGLDRGFSTGRISTPRIFHHDGTVWALYSGKPDGECTWAPRRLSEYYAAQEAFEASEQAAGR